MKKTVLTFAFVAFGMSVAIAQTTPAKEEQKVESEQSITLDKMSAQPAEEVAGGREIKEEELPLAVQRSIKEGEFKAWKIVAVRELQANNTGEMNKENAVQVEEQAAVEAAPLAGPVFYEVELISEDMQDELKDSQEQTEEIAQEAAEEGAVAQEKMVAVKVPGVVLRYDVEGKLLSRAERVEAPEDKK